MTNFVLVGTQRSGTTLIRTSLDSHPDILCLGETFYINKSKRKSGSPLMGKKLSKSFSSWRDLSYQQYLEQSINRRLFHLLIKGWTVEQYLDGLYETQGYNAVGFKLMMDQLNKFPNLLPYIKSHNIRIIHVLRKNVFSILLSLLSMKARGYAHSSSSNGNVVKLVVPIKDLEKRLHSLQQAGQKWIELFKDYPAYMMITYEDFIKDKDGVGKDILKFLDVESSVMLSSELKKLNNAPISDVVENLSEVQECLSGTQFEWCIDELL